MLTQKIKRILSFFKAKNFNLEKYVKNPILFGKPRKTEYFVDDNKNLAYIVNSKVACTSIKSTIHKAKSNTRQLHKELKKFSYFGSLESSQYFTFTFVRNPFSRVVSLYRERVEFPKNVEYFKKLYFGWLVNSKSFEQFVNRISKIPDFWADRHFISQHIEISSNKKYFPNFIGKFENLNADFRMIQERFDLRELPHYNGGKIYDYKLYYNKKIVKKIYKRYKKDILTFGYYQDYLELLNYCNNKKSK